MAAANSESGCSEKCNSEYSFQRQRKRSDHHHHQRRRRRRRRRKTFTTRPKGGATKPFDDIEKRVAAAKFPLVHQPQTRNNQETTRNHETRRSKSDSSATEKSERMKTYQCSFYIQISKSCHTNIGLHG
ncbi:hypothetical protein M9H77_13326 [Catharanthus roseus]|uniref:Uncharacterized protein n=1 Tax=Catharanthus roseus TaxID=4058 RepID=A0ACC0BK33_CATRO|nr:hypothetical protein M9H77_13326 [Catharanthus roseus]